MKISAERLRDLVYGEIHVKVRWILHCEPPYRCLTILTTSGTSRTHTFCCDTRRTLLRKPWEDLRKKCTRLASAARHQNRTQLIN